jgi:hypothetical protein
MTLAFGFPAARADLVQQETIASRWGVEIIGVSLSAAGYMLDFRYKVLDENKAGALTRRQDKPYILDQASGAKFGVMRGPKLGSMRNTSLTPVAGRNYSIIFVNPARYVKAGNKVSVVVGEFKVEDVEVR